ncbi:hypothetical protein IV203_024001 [Nitzschia inconspicua]|uniref:Uncharacterized protein n=1 Tax=Nitzschia inconspicua TaxID=303405 RepID=A0A9K3KCH9_9STRA|nr:hypothetical protein IV203_024476 [Nitzschia inconspicua]KAG7340458.1 hypothetical protein IV203_024001 [Nitzschia inconspicua]
MFVITLWLVSSSCEALGIHVTSHVAQLKRLTAVREMNSGSPFHNRAADLEAMGGDPFFLEDEEETNEENAMEQGNPSQRDAENEASILSAEFVMAAATLSAKSPVNRFVTDGLGPCPKSPPQGSPAEASDEGNGDWEWDGVVDDNAHMDIDDW